MARARMASLAMVFKPDKVRRRHGGGQKVLVQLCFSDQGLDAGSVGDGLLEVVHFQADFVGQKDPPAMLYLSESQRVASDS